MLILQNNRFDDLMLGLARTFGKTRRTTMFFICVNIRDKIDFLLRKKRTACVTGYSALLMGCFPPSFSDSPS